MSKNKNIVILKNYLKLEGFNKIIGLMGKEKGKIVIFKTRFGIHTFFLKFPIDVIIISKDNRVELIKKSLRPNKIFLWDIKYDTVIELPSGMIEKLGINIGSILKF